MSFLSSFSEKLGKFIKQMVFSMNFDFLYSFNNLEIEYSIVLGISSEWNFQIFDRTSCAWRQSPFNINVALEVYFSLQEGRNNLQIEGIIVKCEHVCVAFSNRLFVLLISREINTQLNNIKATTIYHNLVLNFFN